MSQPSPTSPRAHSHITRFPTHSLRALHCARPISTLTTPDEYLRPHKTKRSSLCSQCEMQNPPCPVGCASPLSVQPSARDRHPGRSANISLSFHGMHIATLTHSLLLLHLRASTGHLTAEQLGWIATLSPEAAARAVSVLRPVVEAMAAASDAASVSGGGVHVLRLNNRATELTDFCSGWSL